MSNTLLHNIARELHLRRSVLTLLQHNYLDALESLGKEPPSLQCVHADHSWNDCFPVPNFAFTREMVSGFNLGLGGQALVTVAYGRHEGSSKLHQLAAKLPLVCYMYWQYCHALVSQGNTSNTRAWLGNCNCTCFVVKEAD